MQFVENNKIQVREMLDYIGVPAFVMSFFLNISSILTGWNINAWLVLATSIMGILYVAYKIYNEHKETKLLSLRIKREQMEIDKLQ